VTKWSNDVNFCHDLPTRPQPGIGKILVTGATGYIGGRLIPELLARGYHVVIMVRGGSLEHQRRWPDAEVIVGDAGNYSSLLQALEGICVAYYLIHSLLLGPKRFNTVDIKNANNFVKAAEAQNIKRIIYLGGLGDVNTSLSAHLESRLAVADELMKGLVPTTFLRAAIVIGSGSASYEIIEHLIINCPIISVPSWAKTKCQPISIRNVIKYLVGCLESPETAGKAYDIGDHDILTYEAMLKTMADIYKIKRLFIRLPFNSVKFYAYIASLLTPVPASIIRCLMESCHCDVVCHNDDIKKILPFDLLTYKEALLRALSREDQDRVSSRWSDAYPPAHELAIKLHELNETPQYKSSYSILSKQSADALYASVCRVGGKEGWFQSNFLWSLRGLFDRLIMGVGTSRGRRSTSELRVHDVIDFWRVEDMQKDRILLLRAEMKLPGRAWLEFVIDRAGNNNRLSVTSYYQTSGIWGNLYWYLFFPAHFFIFNNLINQIEKRSWVL
jgi:uncharacterized protein YbjT (DUF2867 family)